MDNARLVSLWFDRLAVEGSAQSSLATYRADAASYLAWLDDKPLVSVTRRDMVEYLASLAGLSDSTIQRRRSVARGLHRFLYEEGHGGCVPDLEPMRRSPPLPFAPTMAEVERLLETAKRTAADASVGLYRQAGYARRAALLETIYASGCGSARRSPCQRRS